MQPFPHEAAWAVAAGAVGFGVVQTARLKWRAGLAARRLRRRVARAQAGETRAVEVLARAGFRVLDEQPLARWEVAIDGVPRTVQVRADFLVERDGRSWVAEVKTGDEAPSVGGRETRRQLLEYACAFAAHGVLLVDVEAGRVEEIAFALPVRVAPPRASKLLLAFALGLCAGAAVVAWLGHARVWDANGNAHASARANANANANGNANGNANANANANGNAHAHASAKR